MRAAKASRCQLKATGPSKRPGKYEWSTHTQTKFFCFCFFNVYSGSGPLVI